MKQALGLLEVKGLASAVSAADVMTKSAAVKLLGLEKAKGSGWMTVKLVGDVGAVKAAVEAGEAASRHDGSFVSAKVIPRPGEGIAEFFLASDYGLRKEAQPCAKVEAAAPEIAPVPAAAPEVKQEAEQVPEVKAQPPEAPAQPEKAPPATAKNNSGNKKPPSKGGKK